jgi:hypothetical protein
MIGATKSEGCEEKGQLEEGWKEAAIQRFRENLSSETEESPLLGAITRERLVKTQQAERT